MALLRVARSIRLAATPARCAKADPDWTDSGARVLRIPDELAFDTVDEFRHAVADALRDDAGPVLLDCSPLTFVNVAGVGALVWAADDAAFRRYLANRWWPEQDGMALFDCRAVPVTRYRYRGTAIPSPWSTSTTIEVA